MHCELSRCGRLLLIQFFELELDLIEHLEEQFSNFLESELRDFTVLVKI